MTIVVPPLMMLTLSGELPAVYNNDVVNITGPAVIDGGSQNGRHDGIFHIVSGTLHLKDLKLQHGSRAAGGAVWMGSGLLTADDVRFDSNDAAIDQVSVNQGGAIFNYRGNVTVTNSIFVNNLANVAGGAVSSSFGYFYKDTFIGNRASHGGAFFDGSPTSFPVLITQSTFKNNLAEPQAYQVLTNTYQAKDDLFGGGALHNVGFISVTQTLFQNNQAALSKGGGAAWNQGQLDMNECVMTQNQATAQSAGSNPYNGNITLAWGGALVNYGTMTLVRCSIHDNQADFAGAIFNHGAANLQIFNSTVSNNVSNYGRAPILNEESNFDNASSSGAQIHLVHDTIDPGPNSVAAVDSRDIRTVWLSNSILDGSCGQELQYTVGHSVMAGVCQTEQDPNTVPQGGSDITATGQISLALKSLVSGISAVPEFKIRSIDSSSVAVGIGREGPYGCGNAAINLQDQNLAPRPANACDAGALQAVAVPPHFVSNPQPGISPNPGLVKFQKVDYYFGYSTKSVVLNLSNTGGGAILYQVVDEGGDGAITLTNPGQAQGTITHGQVSVFFTCAPPAPGKVYRREIAVETTAPNQPVANYELVCEAVDQNGLPSMQQRPGPYNMPDTALAQTVHAGFDVTNPGHATLTLDPALANTLPPYGPPVISAPAGQAPASPATTLNPGQALQVDVACTPTSPGVFLNTLTFTTSDPRNPVIQYNLACEAQVTSPPELLHAAIAYGTTPGAHMYGVAVSPDGAQVLAGGGASEATLSAFVRDPSTGALTQNGWVALPGMSAIQSIKYSHDGQYVYYTSAEGNGIVAINSAGDSLGSSQVITSGTPDDTCIINHFIVSCPNNVMYGADGLAVSPDDQFVYVVGYYDNSLTTFQRQPNGQLDLYQIITGTQTSTQTGNGLSGPVKVVTSPDGNDVYVASFNSSTIAMFQRTGAGALAFQAAYQNGIGGLANLGAPSDLAVSPDGGFLYVAASASNAVDVFQRDSATGGLSLSSVITGVTGAWGLAITHDGAGRRLFLTTQSTTNQVRVYGRDQITGALSFVGANTVTDPVFVTSSPDDLDVYASLYSVQALQHFQTVRNAPVLSHISPASAVAGDGIFTITAAGDRFYPDSQIVWNGAPQPTVFVSQHALQASIPAGLIAAQGTPSVLVQNSMSGGGNSNALTFAITSPSQPPVPSIASLDPPAASFGGGDLVVLVHGANFAPSAQVSYNHVSVPTLFLNANLLQITLSADILNTPGDGGLEVSKGGGAPALSAPVAPAAATASSSSTVVSFRVNAPGVPAAPALASLSPASVVSGSAPIWLTVTGHNFSAGAPAQSVGEWNGSVRPSVVIDAHTLMLGLTRADLATAGYGQVTVQTPGYGTSTPLAFRVRLPNEEPIPVVTGDSLKGWTLYVLGSDFVPGAQIFVNGSPRATTLVNAYELTAAVSQADHGVVISVSNPGPGGGMSNFLIGYLARLFLPLVRH